MAPACRRDVRVASKSRPNTPGIFPSLNIVHQKQQRRTICLNMSLLGEAHFNFDCCCLLQQRHMEAATYCTAATLTLLYIYKVSGDTHFTPCIEIEWRHSLYLMYRKWMATLTLLYIQKLSGDTHFTLYIESECCSNTLRHSLYFLFVTFIYLQSECPWDSSEANECCWGSTDALPRRLF